MNYLSMMLEITGSTEISLQFDGSVSLLSSNIGFSFATLQAFGKTLQGTIDSKEQKVVLLECQPNLLKTFPKVYLLQQF